MADFSDLPNSGFLTNIAGTTPPASNAAAPISGTAPTTGLYDNLPGYGNGQPAAAAPSSAMTNVNVPPSPASQFPSGAKSPFPEYQRWQNQDNQDNTGNNFSGHDNNGV